MEKIRQLVTEIEKDKLEEYGEITPLYDSTLTDVLILEWQDLESPWRWIDADKEIKEAFLNSFDKNKKHFSDITLYRGVDKDNFNITDYNHRYTSWSTSLEIAIRFTDILNPMILVYKGPIEAFDISKSNRSEQEFIVPPMNFTIDRMLNVEIADDEKEQAELISNALLNNSSVGDGVIVVLKPLDI